MPRRAEKLADRRLLERLDARHGQGRAAPDEGHNDGPETGPLGRQRIGPARGIMLGVAIGAAAWVLIGLAVLTWGV